MRIFGGIDRFVSIGAIAALLALIAGCAGTSSGGAGPTAQNAVQRGAAADATAPPFAQVPLDNTKPNTAGPAMFVYSMPVNGFTDPNGGGVSPDAASFNQVVYQTAAPPAADLVGSTSTFGGKPGRYVEMTGHSAADQFTGILLLPCSPYFEGAGRKGNCVAGKQLASSIDEFAAVQSWPFYVGATGSSNVGPGAFGFSTDTDDGSYMILAPAAFTYAQPANFQGATGLTAGTALVQNGGAHAPRQVTGGAQIAAGNCGSNLYWLTFEWYEIVGGLSGLSYNWTPAGSSTPQQATQAVLWGKVSTAQGPVVGATVTVGTPKKNQTATLTTDANGCYGYNYLPFKGSPTVSVTATVNSLPQTQQAAISSGQVSAVDFSF